MTITKGVTRARCGSVAALSVALLLMPVHGEIPPPGSAAADVGAVGDTARDGLPVARAGILPRQGSYYRDGEDVYGTGGEYLGEHQPGEAIYGPDGEYLGEMREDPWGDTWDEPDPQEGNPDAGSDECPLVYRHILPMSVAFC